MATSTIESNAQKIARLEAENLQLKAAAEAAFLPISFKVSVPRAADPSKGDKGSDGGAVSLYGLRRFPVTFWAGEWERLIAAIPDLQDFMEANADSITRR